MRAIPQTGTTPWSTTFGFDVTPPTAPTPLPSYPGVLRWTPMEGANSYQVWLIDTGKIEAVRTNVLDEREFYTFHQSLQWIGSVRWRVRAVRDNIGQYRINGLPASRFGPWSPIYNSTNLAVTNGPIHLIGTVSDVFSDGSPTSSAHELMPAFMWSGNQALNGTTAELFRVYVFTDSQCLNPVYTSAVIGGPAWAPRLSGPLALPGSDSSLSAARASYLGDGSESNDLTYDFQSITPNEQMTPATPTTVVPGDVPSAPGTSAPISSAPTSTGSTSSSSGSSAASSSGSSAAPSSGSSSTQSTLGPPVDLWDTDWPASGYYWTVIPVQAIGLGASGTTVGVPGASAGDTAVPVVSTTGLRVGTTVSIGSGTTKETETITGVGGGTISFAVPLVNAHSPGENVTLVGSSVQYQDMELPQDVCAASRVQRFGISSEPSLTTGDEPFATGLSPTGRITSAAGTPSFYGQPLVAWTPAFGASIYQVQWSKVKYPFKPELDPATTAAGRMTYSTSVVLPIGAGTWYYRVRGIDYNLPTGVQQMAWSDPEQIVVTKPKLKIVPAPPKKFKIVGSGTKKTGKK